MIQTLMFLGVTVCGLTACEVGPEYRRPDIAMSPAYLSGQVVAAQPAADTRWWYGFHDSMLIAVIDRTVAQNLDLTQAAARVSQARAAAGRAAAALLPHAELESAASSTHESLDSPFGEVAHAVGGPRNYETYSVMAQASWELDLFGALRREREAAASEAQAATITAAAVRNAVTAEAADAYLQLRGLQVQLQLAASQEETQAKLVELVRLRVGQGVSADRDLQRAVGELERVRASTPGLRAAIDADMNRLDLLMGTIAGTHRAEFTTEAALPVPPPPAGSASPAELLRRRPDIIAAERRLAAASARIGTALAGYYPHLSFSGLLGFESRTIGDIFSGDAQEGGGLLGLRWRLFDFGRVEAEVALARGREAEALAAYRVAVLRATAEVETALSQFVASRSETEVLGRQIAALTRARDQELTAYQGGVVPLTEVLDADRDLLSAKDRLANAMTDQARAAVASFRALGGGWTG